MGRVQEVILRSAAVLMAGSAVLGLAACGSSDDGKTTGGQLPAGFKAAKTADFSVAVPGAWQLSKHDVDTTKDAFIEARPSGSDINRAQLRVGALRHYKGDIVGAARQAQGEVIVRRSGARQTTIKTIDVPGAVDARRLDFSVPAGGGLAASKIVTVLALSKGRTLVNVSVGVAASDPAAASIDRIIKTLKVTG